MKTKIALAVVSVLAVVFFAWLLVEKSRNSDLTSQLDRLERTSAETDADLKQARQLTGKTANELAEAKRSIESLEREKSRLTSDLARARSSLTGAESDLRSARRDIDDLKKHEAEVKAAKNSLSEAEARVKELESLEAEVTALRQTLAEAEKRAVDINRQSSEWAIRDEEMEKLLTAGRSSETDESPASTEAALKDSQALAETRIKELEAELAECESRRPSPEPEADAGRTAPAGLENQPDDKAAAAGERLKRAEAEVEHWKQEAAKKDAALHISEYIFEATNNRLAEMTGERDRLLAEKNEVQASARTTAADYDRLISELKGQVETKEVAISNLKDEMSLTFMDSVFFAPGRDTVTNDGAKALDKVASALKGLTYHRLMVVGHTDDRPLARNYQKVFSTNWELSSARAVAVARYLTEKGGLPPERLTAAGRSCYDPAAPNDSDENRRRNRRVEIIISSRPLPVKSAGGNYGDL